MRKIIGLILLTSLLLFLFSGCGNKDIIDTTYTYNKAIIELPNGEIIEGTVDNWRDYEDGDQIQVKINGNVYLVHSSDIVLVKD